MRRILLLLLAVFWLRVPVSQAQVPSTYTPQLITYQGAPFGVCSVYQIAEDVTNGNYYTCNISNHTWIALVGNTFTSSLNLISNVPATSLANQSSPILSIGGNYWNGTASAQSIWMLQDVPAAGTNPVDSLVLTGGSSSGGELFHVKTAFTADLAANFGANLAAQGTIFTAVDSGGQGFVAQGTSAATSVLNVNSATAQLFGAYWTGSTSAPDSWTIVDSMGTGANPTSTLSFTHSGTPGIAALGIPNAGSNPLGASLNVKAFPYSAVGDGKFFVDGVTNGGNNQLTSASVTFAASDVGHTIVCYHNPQNPSVGAWAAGQTTVATFVNSGTITYTGTNGGVATSLWCTITNPADHTAIAQAFSDAKTTFNGDNGTGNLPIQGPANNIYLPRGIYGIAATLNNLVSTGSENCVGIKGDGIMKTGLIPEFTFTNAGIASGGWLIHDRCSGADLENFYVEAASNPVPTSSTGGLIALWGSSSYLSNVAVYDHCSLNAGTEFGIVVPAGNDVVLNHPKVIAQSTCGGTVGGLQWTGTEGDIYSPFLSNTGQNFQAVNCPAGNTGAGTRIWGGVIDEGSVTSFQNCVDFWSIGTTWTGGANCVSIDATSVVWFFGGYCGTFATNTGSGPTVASGGQAYFTGIHVRGQNAGSYCWNAAAVKGILDEGGNSCTLAGGATTYNAGSQSLTFPLQLNTVSQLGGQQTVNGNTPSGCSVTGNGTSTCAFDTGSTDIAGHITITAAGTTTAVGLVSFSFSQTYGNNSTTCSANYQSGTGTWAIGAIPPIFITDTTAGASFNINNAGTNLTAASTYKVNYTCYGQ